MWYVILLGGGSGTRMGLGYNKVLHPLCGIPVVRRSAEAFAGHADGLVMVCPAGEQAAFRDALDGLSLPCLFAEGGDTRQASVWSGLRALPPACTHVLVHDAARCLIDAATIEAAKASALEKGSGVAAVPVSDTVKQADGEGRVERTLDRSVLWTVQTPQAFDVQLLLDAHRHAQAHGTLATDDAALVEAMGRPVFLVPGNKNNLKLTTQEDLAVAETILRGSAPLPPLRFGLGYDVHRLVPDRALVLCGVTIPWHLGLDGHSDADVAVHALMDALLGAAALGDIGQHFPDTDPAYRGISSMVLLRHVVALLAEHRLRPVQTDLIIVAQAPRLAPHIPAMRALLAEALSLPQDRVSVKATTTEHLGFVGRGEGISAQASAMLQEV